MHEYLYEGDRHPHVGVAEVGQRGAVVELDQRVDQRLGVHHHLDAVVGEVEQPVRLDRLQPLVHQGGAVHRDPRPHAPVGWARAWATPTPSICCAVKVRKGPPEAVRSIHRHRARPLLPAEALPEGAVLAVHREQAGPGAGHAPVTRAPAITRLSLLARATSIPSVRATTVEASPAAPTMPLRTRSAPEEAISSRTPSSPLSTRPLQAPRARSAASSSASAIAGAPCSRACSTVNSQRPPAASPAT